MGVIVCSFELTGVSHAEASNRMAAVKTTLHGVTLPQDEQISIKSIDYKSADADLAAS